MARPYSSMGKINMAARHLDLDRVRAAFLPALTRVACDCDEPPMRPPLREELLSSVFPRPDPPGFLPPWLVLFTVAQARRSASFFDVPRFSYPSSICSAL